MASGPQLAGAFVTRNPSRGSSLKKRAWNRCLHPRGFGDHEDLGCRRCPWSWDIPPSAGAQGHREDVRGSPVVPDHRGAHLAARKKAARGDNSSDRLPPCGCAARGHVRGALGVQGTWGTPGSWGSAGHLGGSGPAPGRGSLVLVVFPHPTVPGGSRSRGPGPCAAL